MNECVQDDSKSLTGLPPSIHEGMKVLTQVEKQEKVSKVEDSNIYLFHV